MVQIRWLVLFQQSVFLDADAQPLVPLHNTGDGTWKNMNCFPDIHFLGGAIMGTEPVLKPPLSAATGHLQLSQQVF